MRRPHAQRAEPQPPQTLLRKRTLEPERNRLEPPLRRATRIAAGAAASRRSANPSTDADAGSSHCASSIATSKGSLRSSPSSWNTANAIARSSGADPSASSSSSAAESARRCGDGNDASPSGNTGLSSRRARRTRRPSRRPPDGTRNGKTAITRLRHRGLEQRRLPDPASPSSTSALGRSPSTKAVTAASSSSLPTIPGA